MKSATMSKQSEKEREFSSDFQNASEFRGDFQSEIQNTCQNSRRKFIKTKNGEFSHSFSVCKHKFKRLQKR